MTARWTSVGVSRHEGTDRTYPLGSASARPDLVGPGKAVEVQGCAWAEWDNARVADWSWRLGAVPYIDSDIGHPGALEAALAAGGRLFEWTDPAPATEPWVLTDWTPEYTP